MDTKIKKIHITIDKLKDDANQTTRSPCANTFLINTIKDYKSKGIPICVDDINGKKYSIIFKKDHLTLTPNN